jgi:hypothetical protein
VDSPVDSPGGKDCIGISRTRSAIGNCPADDTGEEGERNEGLTQGPILLDLSFI